MQKLLYPFLQSSSIVRILNQAEQYKKLPSEILRIDKDEEYLAFCFDEACAYIFNKMQERDNSGQFLNTPKWIDETQDFQKANDNKDFLDWVQGHKFS